MEPYIDNHLPFYNTLIFQNVNDSVHYIWESYFLIVMIFKEKFGDNQGF